MEATKSMKKLEQVAKKSIEEGSRKIIKDIPLDEIDFHPNERDIYNLSDIERLAESIKRNGFFGAIDIYQKSDGRYQISSGHRRYEAMKFLGRKTIPSIISPMEDDITVNKKLILNNINDREITPLELSNAIIFYETQLLNSNFTGEIMPELSQVFGMSVTKISQLKAINKLSEEIQAMANTENFPYEAFYDAATFSKENQKKLFDMITDYVKNYPEIGLTQMVVKQCINHVKEDIKREKEKKEREKILKDQSKLSEEIRAKHEETQKQPEAEEDPASHEIEKAPEQEEFPNGFVEAADDYLSTIVETSDEGGKEPIVQMDSYEDEDFTYEKTFAPKSEPVKQSFAVEIQMHINRLESVLEGELDSEDKESIPQWIGQLEKIIKKLKEV